MSQYEEEQFEVESEKIKDVEYEGWFPRTISQPQFLLDNRKSGFKDCGYGYTTQNELLQDAADGKIYDPHQFKALFKNGRYVTKLRRLYAVIPDELIEETYAPIIEGRFDLYKKEKNRNETRTFWNFVSKNPETRHKIKGASF